MNFAVNLVNAIAGLPPALLYVVIVVWMSLESAGAPIPNEALLLFCGYLVYLGHLSLPIAWLAALGGTLIGASVSRWIAYRYGPAGVDKVGRYVLLNRGRLRAAEAWFARWGPHTIFLARLTPIVRTVISYPAGLAKMPYRPFVIATAFGAAIWNLLMLLIGQKAGEHWSDLFDRYHTPALIVGLLVIIAVVAYLALEHAVKRRFVEGG